MTGTDGPENKLYRKVVAPYFNQTIMDHVFRESLDVALSLLQVIDEHAGLIDTQLRPMLSKLALHILAKCGFGKEGSCLQGLRFSEDPPNGHELSFADTFLGIDQDLPLIVLTPLVLLNNSPLQVHKRGKTLKTEMQRYLLEAVEQRRTSNNNTAEGDDKDLLDMLVEAGDHDGLSSENQILGNIFILHFAGHESNAHALQFALLNLACQPQIQAKVQNDIDRIGGSLPPELWSYTQHYAAFAQSLVGAAIHESLRVYTVLPIFMKETTEKPVIVTLDGNEHIIPPDTLIVVNTSATHRNPTYWGTPTGTASEGATYAASSFDPQRWLDQDGQFLVPEPGSYIPFSDGPRGCIGQRFAMVELCASLALILRHYTIELAAASSDECEENKTQQAIRDRAIHQLSGGIMFNMTLRLGDKIPARFTKRKNVRA